MKKNILSFLLLFSILTYSQLNVNNNTFSPADLVLSKLIGAGISVSNVTYNGVGLSGPTGTTVLDVNNQLGFYTTGATATNLGLTSGLLMTTGSALGAVGPNGAGGNTTASNFPKNNDPDLSLITPLSVNNICILEFDFVPQGPVVKFDFVFASEEYPEFVGTTFNDVFGFFLSGPGIFGPYSNDAKNIALVPNTTTPITITNVSPITNNTYYVNNVGGASIQYDGFTTPIQAISEVTCGLTYHIKLAIADVGDSAYDSAVFFKEDSFSIPSINLGNDLVGPSKACCGDKLTFTTPFNLVTFPGALHEWFFNNVLIFSSTTSNVFVFENPTCTDGTLRVKVTPYPSQLTCCFEDSKIIQYQNGPILNTPAPLTLCSDTPSTATGSFNLNMQINNIIPNFNSDYEDLGFYLTKEDALANTNEIPSATWSSYSGINDQSIFLGVANFNLTGSFCRSVMEFKLNFVSCDDVICTFFPTAFSFDLTTRKPLIYNGFDPTKYTIRFFEDAASALAGTPFISPENAYLPTFNPKEIFVQYFENSTPVNKQFTQFTIAANQANFAGSDGNLTFCTADVTNYNLFDYISGEQSGGTWSIVSGNAANSNLNLAAGTIASANIATNYVLEYKVNSGSICPEDISVLNVTINAVCGAQTPPDLVLCDVTGNDQIEIFDLSQQNTAVLGTLNSTDYTITYHQSSANAISGALPITPNTAFPNSSNPQTIYIRVIKNSDNTVFDTTKFFQLKVNTLPTLTTFSGTATICVGSSTVLTFSGGTPDAIVTYTDGVTNFTTPLNSSGAATVTVSPSFIGATTYSLVSIATTGIPVCTNTLSGSVVITVNALPNVTSFTGGTTICEGATITLSFVGTPNATVTYTDGVTTFTEVLLADGTGSQTFTPTMGTTYSLVSISSAGPPVCTRDLIGTLSTSVTVITLANAGTDGSTTVCETSTGVVDLFSLITGEQSGGVWSYVSGTGATYNLLTASFIPAAGATNYVFEYTVTGTSPCVNDVSRASILLTGAPSAGTNGSVTLCNTSASVNLFTYLGSSPDTGGTWSPALASGTGMYNPAVDAPQVYTYTLNLAGCTISTATVTVTENQQPDAGTNGTATICESATNPLSLFSLLNGTPNTGGTWTRTTTGGTFDAVAGTFIPAIGITNQVFRYSFTGTAPCIPVFSEVSLIIDDQPFAGTPTAPLVQCASDFTPINLFTGITGEQTLGIWTQLSGNGGSFNATTGTYTPDITSTGTYTFQYSFAANGACLGSTAIVTININPAPTNITLTGPTIVCTGTVANMILTATPGTILTWNGTPTLVTIPASGTITLPQSPTLPVTNYVITNATLNGCSVVVTGVTFAVSTAPTPQFTATGQIADYAICNGDNINLAALLTSTVAGATFEWTATFSNNINNTGLVQSGTQANINQVLSLIDPTQPSTATIQVRPVIGTCKGTPQDIVITVNTTPIINSVVLTQATLCNGNQTTLNITAVPTAQVYNWVVSNVNGVVIVGGATSGTSTSPNIPVSLELVDDAVAGSITFTITPRNGTCIGASFTTAPITVNPIPGAPIAVVAAPICSGQTTIGLSYNPSFPVIAGTEIVWSVVQQVNVTGATDGSGIAPAPILQTLINGTNNQGYVIYSIKSKLGTCESASITVRVNVNPKPKPILAAGYICVDQVSGNTFQSYFLNTTLTNTNFRYKWFKLNTTTNLYEEILGAINTGYEVTTPGTYQVEVTDITYTTNCTTTSAAVVVEEVFPATDFTYTVTDAFTNNATVTINVNPQGTGSLIYALDGGAFQSSNIFTGVAAGVHEIMVEDTEGCTKLSKPITVIDYPKYFTPNGDGIHDTWNIIGMNQPDAKLYIFDRYGKLLKQISPSIGSLGWDGTFNGAQAPSTDYWFTIDFKENNVQKEFKAHFSLKR